MMYTKKEWVEWVEPFGMGNEPVYSRVDKQTAIKHARRCAETGGNPLSDEEALYEFMVVHWAAIKKEYSMTNMSKFIVGVVAIVFALLAAFYYYQFKDSKIKLPETSIPNPATVAPLPAPKAQPAVKVAPMASTAVKPMASPITPKPASAVAQPGTKVKAQCSANEVQAYAIAYKNAERANQLLGRNAYQVQPQPWC